MPYKTWPARIAALLVCGGLAYASILPDAGPEERAALKARFAFTRLAMPQTGAPLTMNVRPVHPDMAHIARWISAIGTSVSLGDIDEDGVSDDVCAVEPRSGEVLVAPAPGSDGTYAPFALNTEPAWDPDVWVATGCKIGDFNEDGLADLMVHFVGRTPLLFLRRPNTALALPGFAVQGLVEQDQPWWTSTVLQVDVDGDGHLDLLVGNYFPDGQVIFGEQASGPVHMHDTFSRARNGGTNRIYLWESATIGDTPSVRYLEVPNPFPGTDATAWTLALGAADLDQDGLSELYVANDFGPDSLYFNQSTPGEVKLVRLEGERGFFIPSSLVLGRDSFKGMGVEFGDLNDDGLFDLFVSNITVHGGLEESHFLFLSEADRMGQLAEGHAPYRDAGEQLGVSRSSWAWDTRLADFDNDGDLELMQATGFLKGTANWWADLAEFANTNDHQVSDPGNWPSFPDHADVSGHDAEPFYTMGADGRFVDLSAELGFDGGYNSRGLALADTDLDGDLDLALANQWEDSWFFRNDAPNPGAYLGLHVRFARGVEAPQVLAGAAPASDGWPAVGALAKVVLPDGRMLVRQVDGGNGHSGASASELHFGLGELPAGQPVQVELRWRDLDGQLRSQGFTLSPGWHTVLLGAPALPWPTPPGEPAAPGENAPGDNAPGDNAPLPTPAPTEG